MSSRNRTDQFLRLRNGMASRRVPRPAASLKAGFGSDGEPLTPAAGAASAMESGDLGSRPMYMEVMEDAKADMERIQKAMDDLSQLHKEHLKVHFDAGDEDEQQIDILTGKIKGMFKSCESKVKSIGIPPVHGVERSADEEAMRKNIQRSLAAHLTEQGAEFRKQQRAYLQKLKTQKDRQRQFSDAFGENEDEEKSERIKEIEQKIYDPSFTEEQIAQMILQETLIEERDKEIREIAQSIAEIADMFKDLNQLVIEQGTILDRIDANLDTASKQLKEAVKELDKASEYQRRYRMKLCILLMILAVVALGVAVMVRAGA